MDAATPAVARGPAIGAPRSVLRRRIVEPFMPHLTPYPSLKP